VLCARPNPRLDPLDVFDVHDQAFPQRGKGGLELVELRAVRRGEQAVDLRGVPRESTPELRLGHVRRAHGFIGPDLRLDEGWDGDAVLGPSGRRRRNRAPVLDVGLEDRGQRVLKSLSRLAGNWQGTGDRPV